MFEVHARSEGLKSLGYQDGTFIGNVMQPVLGEILLGYQLDSRSNEG